MTERPVLRLTVLMCLLAISDIGVFSCVPLTPAPAATPTATPAVPATFPAITPDWPTPTPMPTPRPGATPTSTVTNTYTYAGRTNNATATTLKALKAGDIVLLKVKLTKLPGSLTPAVGAVGVEDPKVQWALTPVTFRLEEKTISFKAAMDGDYKVIVSVEEPGGVFTITTEIYR